MAQEAFSQSIPKSQQKLVEQLSQDIYSDPNILCQCNNTMEYLCISKCEHSSLHCGNKKCKISHQRHELCKIIKLDTLTKLLSLHIKPHLSFLQSLFQFEENFIGEIKKIRQNLVEQLLYGELQAQERVVIQEIYHQKSAKFSKGIHINQLYNKLTTGKMEASIAEDKIKLYRNEVDRIYQQLNEYLQSLVKRQSVPSKSQTLIIDSMILTQKQMKFHQKRNFIMSSLEYPKGLKLLFRASQHLFSTAKFYEYCDKVDKVLILIKTQFGNIIGGYNHLGWNSQIDGQYTIEQQKGNFIFSIDLLQKMEFIQQNQNSYINKAYGPSFGNGHDIYLSDFCNNNKSSFANFPYSYNFKDRPYPNNQQSYTAFCGVPNGHNFSVIQYEVFKVIK